MILKSTPATCLIPSTHRRSLTIVRFQDTAARFASQVLFDSPITSYLDLGVGTGLTAMATTRLLVDAGHDFRLPAFLTQAFDKLKSEFPGRRWGGEPVATLKSDVFTDMVRLGKRLLEKHGLSGVSLITTQRVFLNLRKDRRAEQLRRWASLSSPGGRLIVGVAHPRRRVAAFMIGRSPSTCRVIVGSATWDRCRSYARSLADQTGLRIVNDMPPHLSTSIEEDGTPEFASWVEACKAETLPAVLGEDEMDWFGLRYATESIPLYERQGFECSAEITTIIAVFERDAVEELTASTSALTMETADTGETAHTKYAIDESLTGAARRKAIEKARKESKKAKKAMGERDNDDEGTGISGAVARLNVLHYSRAVFGAGDGCLVMIGKLTRASCDLLSLFLPCALGLPFYQVLLSCWAYLNIVQEF